MMLLREFGTQCDIDEFDAVPIILIEVSTLTLFEDSGEPGRASASRSKGPWFESCEEQVRARSLIDLQCFNPFPYTANLQQTNCKHLGKKV